MRGGRGRARRGRGGRAAAEDVLVAKALERAAAQAKAARRRSAPSRGARSAVMRAKAAVARTAEELEVEEVRAAVPQGAATPLATALPASRRAAAAVDRRLGGAVVGVLGKLAGLRRPASFGALASSMSAVVLTPLLVCWVSNFELSSRKGI